jgi:hypothetical protein
LNQPSRINSLSGFIWLQKAQPDQLTLWLHRASTSPARTTHSLASSEFNEPSRINSISGFIGLQQAQPDQLTLWLQPAQPDQLTLWLHLSSLNSTPHRTSLSEQQHSQQSSKQRHRQPTSTTSRPAIAFNC